jgi:hypothetical protein
VKINRAFLKLVFISWVGAALLLAYPLSLYASTEVVESVVASGMTSLFNLLLGYLFIEFGFDKSNTTFLKIVLGGSVIRLLFLVAIVFILIKVYQFHSLSLMVSLLLFYSLNLVLEIYFLQKKVSLKH